MEVCLLHCRPSALPRGSSLLRQTSSRQHSAVPSHVEVFSCAATSLCLLQSAKITSALLAATLFVSPVVVADSVFVQPAHADEEVGGVARLRNPKAR